MVRFLDMDEPVRKIEVQLSVERHPEGGGTEDEDVPGGCGDRGVGEKVEPARGETVAVQRLPHRHLNHALRPTSLMRPQLH